MTAYTGLLDIGKPKPGETVVVAAASGAVGSAVGQIARIKGARAVGIAGGKDKCDYVKNELGFDDCLDHRDPDLAAKLKEACPNGIDVYFENVGGTVFEAVFPRLNDFARIPVCGLIADYNTFRPETPTPKWADAIMRAVLMKRLNFRGFIVSDFAAMHGDFLRDMSQWIREGKVKYREFVTEGLASAPDAFIGLLKGANFGKQLVRVGPDPRLGFALYASRSARRVRPARRYRSGRARERVGPQNASGWKRYSTSPTSLLPIRSCFCVGGDHEAGRWRPDLPDAARGEIAALVNVAACDQPQVDASQQSDQPAPRRLRRVADAGRGQLGLFRHDLEQRLVDGTARPAGRSMRDELRRAANPTVRASAREPAVHHQRVEPDEAPAGGVESPAVFAEGGQKGLPLRLG